MLKIFFQERPKIFTHYYFMLSLLFQKKSNLILKRCTCIINTLIQDSELNPCELLSRYDMTVLLECMIIL